MSAEADLWAVTCHFNPLGWKSRLAAYRGFRAHLAAPLLTVEWSPEGRFELGPDDADVLLQLGGGDLMWQKERLLNLGVARLPTAARYVAWLDADVVFLASDWVERARDALERSRAVQLFAEVHYLDPARTRTALETPNGAARDLPLGSGVPGSARLVAEAGADALVDADLAGQARPPGTTTRLPRNPGLAWAARRADLAATGLFERAVMGSGDLLFLFAALERNQRWLAAARAFGYGYLARSYPRWAQAVHGWTRGAIGHLEGTVLHLYHGEIAHRGYKERHRAFDALGVDVERDVVAETDAPLRFAHHRPHWEAFMRDYFASRREDGGDSAP